MKRLINFDPKLIDFLINIEKERKKRQHQQNEQPFLDIPLQIPVYDEEDEENSVIEMDI